MPFSRVWSPRGCQPSARSGDTAACGGLTQVRPQVTTSRSQRMGLGAIVRGGANRRFDKANQCPLTISGTRPAGGVLRLR